MSADYAAAAIALLRGSAPGKAKAELETEINRLQQHMRNWLDRLSVGRPDGRQAASGGAIAIHALRSILRTALPELVALETQIRIYLARLEALGADVATPTASVAETVAATILAVRPDITAAARELAAWEAARLPELDRRLAALAELATLPRGAVRRGFHQDEWLAEASAALAARDRAAAAADPTVEPLIALAELLAPAAA